MNNKLVVAYFSSDLFAEPCGVSIASLFENNKFFEKIIVYIIDNQISDANKMRFQTLAEQYHRNIEMIKMPKPQTFFSDQRFTIESLGNTFGRMILGELLPKHEKKVLCLDSDTLIVDSLEKLWNTNIEDFYIAGVDSAPGIAMMKKTLKIPPGTLYCNGGVFLMNLEAIRKDGVENKYKTYIKNVFDKGNSLGAYEEEVMNKCCYPKVLRLHPKYNLMTVNLVMDYDSFIEFRSAVNYYSREEMAEALANPTIIHAINTFYIKKRIWEYKSDSPYAELYTQFRNITPWRDLPRIKQRKTIKQLLMKQIWHMMPQKVAFKLAAFVRNQIRPRMSKKRDDE